MGKIAKGSRKGKKAWGANISTEDIEDFFEQSNKDALSGGSLSQLPNDSLFYVDNSKDLSVKRKIEKHREKVLRCDSVLQKNPFVRALPSSKPKQKKKSKKENKDVVKEKDETRDGQKSDGASASGMVDIWANEGEGDNPKKVPKPSVIPAVEVEASGCSYNPTFESHQESLAQAVAEEMQKVYRKELGPEPVPITVPGEVINDEDRYFLEVDNGSDDENVENLSENQDTGNENRSRKTKKVTRVELNKRERHKELHRKEAEAKKREELSKQIDSLPNIIEEITKEDEEKQKRHIRRVVAMQERLKVRPPRLGKHKFEPAPTQVLLSEEITGSLRKLKGCCTLVKDRFKSLEKRGLIVPVKGKRLDELSTLLLLFLSLVVAILLIRVTVDYLKQRL
ncbi:Ribosome biogenesis protein NOP53 [Citrus sinensis]|uniref:Ribosome biogenesis protein NOP53 n=1 Tax=Citrus sinensis TaxID=2711 RepID=A0ACB8L255_CITSI|nr:Ribosome biogenesis protein NOP53 [Citrus sinensis]